MTVKIKIKIIYPNGRWCVNPGPVSGSERDDVPARCGPGPDGFPEDGVGGWRSVPSTAGWFDEPGYWAALAEEEEPPDADVWEDPDNAPPPGLDDAQLAALIAEAREVTDDEARAAARAARLGTTGGLAMIAAAGGRRGPGMPGSARRFPGEHAGPASGFGSGRELDTAVGCPTLGLFADEAAGDDDRYTGATDDELLGAIAAWDRLEAHMAARKHAAAAELLRRRPGGQYGDGGYGPGVGPPPGGPLFGAVPPGFVGHMNLTVPLTTVLGLADRPGETSPTGEPGVSFTPSDQDGPPGGYGTWRLSTGTPGHPGLIVALGPLPAGECDHRYQAGGHDPGVLLRHLAQVRHATCTGPGCRRPAGRCDFEHDIPYGAGGRTCLCNGDPKCRYDHRLKQDPRWKVDLLPGGDVRWTTPSGRRYVTVTGAGPGRRGARVHGVVHGLRHPLGQRLEQ
jgi:hypothetical protein